MKQNYILIGSHLMISLFEGDKISKRVKKNSDVDILVREDFVDVDYEEMFGTKKVDVHRDTFLYELLSKRGIDKDTFFTLKASHVYFDKEHFDKTIYDLFLMSAEGCVVDKELHQILYDHWLLKFGEKWRADFTKEVDEFFDDAITREFNHDALHKAFAKFGEPAFYMLQEPDQTTVYVCPTKFENLEEKYKRAVIIEEAQVLSIERFYEQGLFKNNSYIPYTKMIGALIQRLAPLWMTIYIINNLDYFLKYKENYYEYI